MEKLEKIDRLKERANVTYEEAQAALDQADGDLLDAMVILEKQGKVKEPSQSAYSTQYEEQKEYIRVVDTVEEQKKSAPTLGKTIARVFQILFTFLMHSTFHITKDGKDLIAVPSFVAAIVLLLFWRIALPVALIALLFRVRYSFELEEGIEL